MGETGLDGLYERRFGDPAASQQWRRALWQVLVDDFFSQWTAGVDCVLDYGCGFGEFLSAVDAPRRIGVDLRPDAATYLEPTVEFHVPDGVAIPGVVTDSVDVVFSSNLLEHLESRAQVLELLTELRRVLRPRGSLLLLGPNLRYTGGKYWDFFDHRIALTDRSVVEALELTGYRLTRSIPRFLPYTTVGKRPAPLSLVRLYLRVPLAWRVMGGQFLVVAEPAG